MKYLRNVLERKMQFEINMLTYLQTFKYNSFCLYLIFPQVYYSFIRGLFALCHFKAESKNKSLSLTSDIPVVL